MRFFAAILILLLLILCLWSIIPLQSPSANARSVHSTSKGHNCAPSVPPPVSGSPAPAPATPGSMFLNEVLLNPKSVWNCSDSGSPSLTTDAWEELYNPQDQPLNLYAAHASLDTGSGTNAYYLPFGAAIPAHGFLVLFPASNAGFFSTETPNLRLVIPDTTTNQQVIVDQVTVPQLAPDQSYARIPDGAASWQLINSPTIDASNGPPQMIPDPTPSSTVTVHGSASPTSAGNGHQATVVSGAQPGWNKLHLPTLTAAPTFSDNVPSRTSSSLPAPPTNDGLDIPHRILLTGLATALALTLFWCWRLFRVT